MPTAHKAALVAAGLIVSLCIPTAQATAAEPDRSPALDRYYDQRPAWHRCGSKEQYPAALRCATVEVPLDYMRPAGPTLRMEISRLRTSVPGKRRGVLLSNPGGPGGESLENPVSLKQVVPKSVRDRYDLVGFDPRGMGASSPLSCGLTENELNWPRAYTTKSFRKNTALARSFASKCVARDRARLPYITTRNTARDMDVIRAVLAEKRISYLGTSYGTYLGAVYTQLFPARSDRIVLDSSTDPNRFGRGTYQAMAESVEPAFRDWTRLVARRDSTYHLGDTPAKVRAAFFRLIARADRTPLKYNGSDLDYADRAVTGADVRDSLRLMFFYEPYQAARDVVSLRKARATRPDPQPSDGPADSFEANFVAQHWAIICADNSASWPRDPSRYRRDAIRDGRRLPLYGDFTSNITPCAFWPRGAEPATRVDNTVGALVLQNQWDSQTPAASGRAMHRALRGSRLVMVQGGRDHGVYGVPGTPACATKAVNTYLVTGRLPSKDITCRA
ncbi:alpha/beta hydrolase [Streptomyces graminofaciens]|uniref:Hydrolase, alpha/beta domain protein n=1 Tax=Streptomyces graminofaciens TaxID=68212 RepID=A0ABN5VC69_9ACTN|nr:MULTISPECIES: alpha/beta hydrolase [Streptomyces]WLW56977.1 alpha/beta hydrolase [Streptomyces coralus]BBC30540.1 Hydrolase, alpha/beta domain protein [Streptomyces graminofaciens]